MCFIMLLTTVRGSEEKFRIAHSLGAKFQKAASFWVRLTQKMVKVRYVHVAGKYSWNINSVGVEVDRGSKVFKMRDVQGYPRAPKTVHV